MLSPIRLSSKPSRLLCRENEYEILFGLAFRFGIAPCPACRFLLSITPRHNREPNTDPAATRLSYAAAQLDSDSYGLAVAHGDCIAHAGAARAEP